MDSLVPLAVMVRMDRLVLRDNKALRVRRVTKGRMDQMEKRVPLDHRDQRYCSSSSIN